MTFPEVASMSSPEKKGPAGLRAGRKPRNFSTLTYTTVEGGKVLLLNQEPGQSRVITPPEYQLQSLQIPRKHGPRRLAATPAVSYAHKKVRVTAFIISKLHSQQNKGKL